MTGWHVFELTAVAVFSLGALYILLPIFKFDGYWLWTDLLGVDNLSRQVRRVARHVRDRVLRRPTAPLPWPRWASLGVLCYAAFTVLFLMVFLLRIVVTIPNLVADYPARVAGLVRDLSTPPHTPATGRLSSVLGPTYVLLGITFAVVRLGMRGSTRYVRRSRGGHGRLSGRDGRGRRSPTSARRSLPGPRPTSPGAHTSDHADAHVERAVQLLVVERRGHLAHEAEQRRHRPRAEVDDGADVAGEHPRDVLGRARRR